MLAAGHSGRRLLILSVSTLGFFIPSFSVVIGLAFTGPSSPSSTATPSKFCTTLTLNVSD